MLTSPSTFPIANAAPVRSELGVLLARYAIRLNAAGELASSRRLAEDETATEEAETLWYAYAEPLPDSGFFAGTYPDLLRADMTQRFIELTHEVYKQEVGDEFGTTVPSMFTDEPQYCPITTLDTAGGKQDVFLPWTAGIEASFAAANEGTDALLDLLPSIIYDRADGSALARYRFIDHVAGLFANNYIGELAKWCDANSILATGHMNAEPRLGSQTAQTGDVMRSYEHMGIPGIDVLCDSREYNTAKQASSVARQQGRRGVMSELYGVTGWRWTFEGHKGQGDWQAALGVTFRVPHLFWSTMAGEAKRDYPACIGYQSPWWREYNTVETHFGRVNAAMTRGRAVTKVAVVHPVESYWLANGPKDANADECEEREKAFADLTSWLLFGAVDFDFVCESILPRQCEAADIKDGVLPVGECAYEAVIVPNLATIRSTTVERLRAFAAAGGTVIFAGSTPTLVDAQPPQTPIGMPGATVRFARGPILSALQPFRDVDLTVSESTLYRTKGHRADSLMYQLREDGAERFLFVCNTDRKEACPVDVAVRGEWAVEVLDTLSGEAWEIESTVAAGSTRFTYWFDGCESGLFRLHPRSSTVATSPRSQVVLRTQFKTDRDLTLSSTSLSEPNVLLLDHAEWLWAGTWEPLTEVLAVDQELRERLGFFKKGAKIPQAYTISAEQRAPVGDLVLRFTFNCEVPVTGAKLAIELPHTVGIVLDREPVASTPDGWYVDRDIRTVPLPNLAAGEHTLDLTYAYGQLTALERVYVLGDFGVDVRGRNASIVATRPLTWGDITRQGLPFYTGNITYHCTLTSDGATPLSLRVPHFAGPVVAVDVDGTRAGLLMTEPRACALGILGKGEHVVDVTCFGDRHNAFGPIHLVPGKTNWLGADAWRSDLDWWSAEPVLEAVGVLGAPLVCVPGREVSKQVRRPLAAH